jgi:hypothetical protein
MKKEEKIWYIAEKWSKNRHENFDKRFEYMKRSAKFLMKLDTKSINDYYAEEKFKEKRLRIFE